MSEEKNIYILGLNYIQHDASASLFRNGELLASAMEERFTRIKKCRNFPINAINFCLKQAKITMRDVGVVTFYFDPVDKYDQSIHFLGKYYPKCTTIFKGLAGTAEKGMNVEKEIREKLDYLGEIYYCWHHNAHIASSFFLSEFKECAALSVDGLGEIASTVMAEVKNKEIKNLKQIDFPHSLGMLYSAITHYLGFIATSDAGKVMGLSSYGNPETYIKQFRDIVKLRDAGEYEFDLSYFEYHHHRDVWVSEKFINIFGPKRNADDAMERRHEDVAAALQAVLEEVFFHMAKYVKETTKQDYLCLSGGVTLNSVANGKLLESGMFKDIFVPPPTGDDGTSLGGPLYYNFCVLKNKERYPLRHPYWGPGYTNGEIEKIIKKFHLKYYKSEDVCKETAEFLAQNKIVGWFQGRMEIGPRALGNRSILANPGLINVKEVLNYRVKFREPFRPFAPSILEEEVKNWFEFNHPAPYMLFVFDIKKEKRGIIPGVTHVDGTGRLHTVNKNENERYHRLISEFNGITGIPIVVNTSFNINGEPIIESPVDAIRCFLGNGIDCLVMGDYVIKKEY